MPGIAAPMMVKTTFSAALPANDRLNATTKGEHRMEFSGTQTIAAPREKVWAFLEDVNNVAACAPGFQSLEELGEEHWKALVVAGVGSVKAKFSMDVTRPYMRESDHVDHSRMVVNARGKAPGSAADMSGEMMLTSLDADHTRMDWKANVVVSGSITSVGSRLLQGTVEKLTGQFFNCLKSKLETPAPDTINTSS